MIKSRVVHLPSLFLSNLILISSLCILMTGCSSVQYMPTNSLSPKESSQLYIMRPSAFFGGGMRAPIYVNGQEIGKLANGGLLIWRSQPGVTEVSATEGIGAVKFDNTFSHRITFNAQKGKTYYIKVSVPAQVNFAGPAFDVQLLDARTGEIVRQQVR